MKKYSFIITVMLFITYFAFGQDEASTYKNRSVNHSTQLGIGNMIITDTYLSPLKYDGLSLSVFHERFYPSSLLNNKLIFNHQYFLQTASTENPIGNSKSYYGNINFKISAFYPLTKYKSLRILGGAGTDLSLGGIYNIRNSNNPAQLKTSVNIEASLLTFYSLNKFTFRWQVSSPFIGMFFSPEYGHSYYEIFVLGNDKGTLHLGLPSNQRAIRNYITIDYPLGKATLRAGYLLNYYRTNVNNLITSLSSHQFIIGLSFESLNFGGNEIKKRQWLKSVYYD